MPSLSEGFSNAVLEAMSMEIPVSATAVEGIWDDRRWCFGCLVSRPTVDGIKVSYLLENPIRQRNRCKPENGRRGLPMRW